MRINEAGAEEEVVGRMSEVGGRRSGGGGRRSGGGSRRISEINRVMGRGGREIADGRDRVAHYADICAEGHRTGAIKDLGMAYNQVEHADNLFESTPRSVDDSGDENGLRGIQSSTVLVAAIVHRALNLRKI